MLLFALIFSLGSVLELPAGLHAPFDELLGKYVTDGRVDYKGFKESEKELDVYLETLGKTDPSSLKKNEKLAFLINAYNAFTVKLILEHYPGIKSIKDISGSRRWADRRWVMGGKKYSLDTIEHEILRKEFKEPRIHFAVNCASRSCPDLLSEAYVASRIGEQLDRAAREFLARPEKGFSFKSEPGFFYGTNHYVYLSSIFKWFGEDFEDGKKTVLDFIAPHLAPEG